MIRPGPRRSYTGTVQRTTFSGGGGPSRVRFVLLAVIALAVLAIGLLAWFLLGRGSGDCTEAYCETTTAEIVTRYGGLWFVDESFVVERRA